MRHRRLEPIKPVTATSKARQRDPFARYREGVDRARAAKRIVTAGEIMTSPVIVLAPDATIAMALSLISERRFRHVPIASGTSVPIGILSDRDVYRHGDAAGIAVTKVMAKDVITSSPDTSIYDVARLFIEERIGAMPVVADGQLAGILTRSDILRTVVHAPMDLWL